MMPLTAAFTCSAFAVTHRVDDDAVSIVRLIEQHNGN